MAGAFLRRGIKIKGCREQLNNAKIAESKPSALFCVSLKPGKGPQSKILVEVGDSLKQGTVIASPSGSDSGFIYSPVSGAVANIVNKVNSFGELSTMVLIKPAKVNVALNFNTLASHSSTNLFGRLVESGSYDNWGQRLPTFHKYINPNAKNNRMLVVKLFDSDPFVFSNQAIAQNLTEEVVKGAVCFFKVSGAMQMVFVLAKSKQADEIIKKIKEVAIALELPENIFKFVKINNVYPYDEEHLLFKLITKHEMNPEEEVENRGIMIENSQSCLNFFRAVYENKPTLSSVYTVSGDNVKKPVIVEVPNGADALSVLALAQIEDENRFNGFTLGGAFNGVGQCDDSIGLQQTFSSMCSFKLNREINKEIDCINCGSCNAVCPMKLSPVNLDNFALNKDYGRAKRYGALSCINCGACSFVCPARRFLAQRISDMANSIREGRTM